MGLKAIAGEKEIRTSPWEAKEWERKKMPPSHPRWRLEAWWLLQGSGWEQSSGQVPASRLGGCGWVALETSSPPNLAMGKEDLN